jgi:putative transposase
MKPKKKCKKENFPNDSDFHILLSAIFHFSNLLWNPIDLFPTEIKTNSWFNLLSLSNNIAPSEKPPNLKTPTIKHNDTYYKSQNIIILPNNKQRSILLQWMESYRQMINATIKFVKDCKHKGIKCTFDFQKLRTNYLIDIKESIFQKSKININGKDIFINKHILDSAIKDVCAMFKSATSNGHKNFRVRYWRKNKPTMILKFEHLLLNTQKTNFCSRVLGKKMRIFKNMSFKKVENDCILRYERRNNTFTLFIPKKIIPIKNDKSNKIIGLDPGLRTFLTGYTNGKCIKIANNLTKTILKLIKKIDSINKNIKNKRRRQRGLDRYKSKLRNRIDDLHWKTIDYLTKNYTDIFLGNMSTKNICYKGKGLPKIVKRVAYSMRLYVFRQRLEYKSKSRNVNYKSVNEKYTTRTCSECGEINHHIGKDKTFTCIHYTENKKGYPIKFDEYINEIEKEYKIERDINSGKNIYMRGIYESIY